MYPTTALLFPCSWLFPGLRKCPSCLQLFCLQSLSHKVAGVQWLPTAFRMRSMFFNGTNKAWPHIAPAYPSVLQFYLWPKPLACHSPYRHMLNIHSFFTLPRMILFLLWLSLLIIGLFPYTFKLLLCHITYISVFRCNSRVISPLTTRKLFPSNISSLTSKYSCSLFLLLSPVTLYILQT